MFITKYFNLENLLIYKEKYKKRFFLCLCLKRNIRSFQFSSFASSLLKYKKIFKLGSRKFHITKYKKHFKSRVFSLFVLANLLPEI